MEEKINKIEKLLVSLYGEKDEIKASFALIGMNSKESMQDHFLLRAILNLIKDIVQRREFWDYKVVKLQRETREYIWSFYFELREYLEKF